MVATYNLNSEIFCIFQLDSCRFWPESVEEWKVLEMSQTNIDMLLELWAWQSMKHGHTGPFANYKEIYDMIDASSEGDAPWKCMKTVVPDDLASTAPSCKKKEYKIWFRDPDVVLSNMLANPDFDGEFDTTPYVEVDANGQRR